jgi:hypothetical protein
MNIHAFAVHIAILCLGVAWNANLVAQTVQNNRSPTGKPVTAAADAQRMALVIGNGSYKDSPLTNPVNDAKAIAQALRENGFTVTLRTNADMKEMLASIRDFGDQLRKGGVGVFYYAGHGMQIKGRNYLIPVATTIAREDEVAYAAVDAQAVLDKMEAAGNGTNIMILDACRNNPFGRSFRGAQQGLAQMDAPVGTLVAFATAPGSVASDGGGQNGLYTQHLLTAMREPGAKVEDVFKRVRTAVRQDSRGKQVPWESTSLEGDFYFKPSQGSEPTEASLEKAMWPLVKNSGNAIDLKAFLTRFPKGIYAAEASARLSKLEGAVQPAQTESTAPKSTSNDATARANPFGFMVGDQWSFQVINKYKNEVVKKVTYRITKIMPDGDLMVGPMRISPEGNVRNFSDERGNTRVYGDAEMLLPKTMQVGHRENFKFSDKVIRSDGARFEQHWRGTLTVTAKERVKVPAGEFDTYRIERVAEVKNAAAGGRSAHNVTTIWYAPQVKYWVAMEQMQRVGQNAPELARTELTSYQVQKPANPGVR